MAVIWIVGGGLIGCGWAVAFAGAGHNTVVIDPAPETQHRLEQTWQNGQAVLKQLGQLKAGAVAPVWAASAAAAGTAPDLVQEALPEQIALKATALAQLEPYLREDTIIASSSSGLSPDAIGEKLRHPERLLIAHPCNPPYLMPVVELCGGAQTGSAVLEQAEQLYTAMGKTVLKLSRPVAGHLVNRLQAALWREAVHLAAEGIASVSDIERAVSEGLAPRWCFVGPTGVFHLAGAEGGIRRCVEQLGTEFEHWWDDLGAPKLDDGTTDILAQGMIVHDPRPVAAIAADRDRNVAALLAVLQENKIKSRQAGSA